MYALRIFIVIIVAAFTYVKDSSVINKNTFFLIEYSKDFDESLSNGCPTIPSGSNLSNSFWPLSTKGKSFKLYLGPSELKKERNSFLYTKSKNYHHIHSWVSPPA